MGIWQRVSLVTNIALLIDVIAIVWTGINISQVVVPALGGTAVRGSHGTHGLAANLFYVLAAIHVLLHIKWIGQTFKRFFIQPSLARKLKSLGRLWIAQTAQIICLELLYKLNTIAP